MILTCPACATSYFIGDDALGPNGRKVRCQACGEVWRATGDEPLELTLTPEAKTVAKAEPAPEPSLAETPAPELPRAFRARAEQQRRLRRAATQGAIWAGLASVFVGLIVAAFLFRVEVVEAFPRAAAAYAMAGVPVNPVGLDFEALTAKEAPNRPGAVLVSGALRNVRDEEIVAPPVRVALLDEHGAELAFKVVRIDAAPVLPGKVQGFAVIIPDPGGHAADISVDFLPAGQRPAAHGASHTPAAAHSPRAPPAAEAPDSAAKGGLRPAMAPGLPGAGGEPLEARPIPVVDRGHGEALSPTDHG